MDVRTVLPCDASSPGLARRLVRGQCADAGADDFADTATLLVSELVTNAIMHARTDVELRVVTGRARLRVEVSDGSLAQPVRRRRTALVATGRGLGMVESLASRWGVQQTRRGKTVWFELA